MEYKCSQCGEVLVVEEPCKRTFMAIIEVGHGIYGAAITCMHRVDVLNKILFILGSVDCARAFSEKNPIHATAIDMAIPIWKNIDHSKFVSHSVRNN